MSRIYLYTTEKVMKKQVQTQLQKGLTLYYPYLIISDKSIEVPKGYSWNGASPKIKIFGKVFGTPEDKKGATKYATLWHDAIYQYSKKLEKYGVTRAWVDKLFYKDLKSKGFKFAFIYYLFVRIFGGVTWKKK